MRLSWKQENLRKQAKMAMLGSSMLAGIILPQAAFAQPSEPVAAATSEVSGAEMATEASSAGNADTSAGDIVVTGSRIMRTDLSAPSPTTIVGETEIRSSGNVTLENTLNEFPQLASGNTSSVGNGGGSGILTANLRGLGATRTLVLVNGRRFVPANADGSVDLTTIPDALVRRVEIITGGASAVYGSDAIAGAVNFILRDNFEGAELSYQYGQTFRDDGFTHKVDGTIGTNFADDRGNITLSASYTKRDPIYQANRKFAEVPLDTVNGQLVPGGSSNIPGTRISLSSSQRASLNGVNLTPTGPCTTVTGIRFGEGGVVLPYCNPESAYNYQPDNILQRPLDRIQVSGIANYEFADDVSLFAEVYYVDTRNGFRQSPESFAPITPGAPSSTLLIPNYATSPGLSASVRQFFASNAQIFDPDGDGTASIVGAGRTADELGPRIYTYDRSSLNVTTGLRGSLPLLGNPWRWEAFGQYQRTTSNTQAQGQISGTRLSLGLDTVTGPNGQVVCRQQVLGCVPVNIFGLDTITPEAGRFLTPLRRSNDRFDRKVAGASISGDLFELPAGPIAIALGTEYRSDEYGFTPSPMDISNEYGARSQVALAGAYDLWELFGETRVPLLSDLPFIKSLSLEAAVRYSNYSTVGGVSTWRVGGEWEPLNWVRIRSAYNRAIRAPTLSELYAASTVGFSSGEDPCIASRQPSAAQQQLCVQQGVPAADLSAFAQANVGVAAQSGGNPNLDEERSKTFTVGAVVRPPFLPGLNLTVDYFNVRVDGAISRVNANQTLNDCFTNLDPDSITCRSIVRLSNGQIDLVKTSLSNIGSLKVEGIDAQADYRLDLPSVLALADGQASLSLMAVASWLFERSTQLLATQAPLDCAGRFGGGCTGTGTLATPDFKLNLSSDYRSGPLSLRVQGRMVGAMKLYPGVSAAVESAPAQWYFDLSATSRLSGGLEVFGGIDNLLDNQPPILGTAIAGDANTDPALYDVIGRRFFVGARVKF
jgi:iron complex outermembrane receptor protein